MTETITVKSVTTGHAVTAPAALWLQCLLEMLPGAQMAELVKRVEEITGAGQVVPAGPRHYHMVAEPGHYGLKGHALGG